MKVCVYAFPFVSLPSHFSFFLLTLYVRCGPHAPWFILKFVCAGNNSNRKVKMTVESMETEDVQKEDNKEDNSEGSSSDDEDDDVDDECET